jgi:hypothetical protein
MRQLRELLESGAAKYLFPLDVDADLAIRAEVYASKFKQLPREEILPALLREPMLVTIYRTAVHLKPTLGNNVSQPTWGRVRAVAGFYNGRSNQILSPGSDGRIDYQSQGWVRLGSFNVMNHFLGALSFVADESVVTFDLSFENDRAAAPAADVVAASPAGKQ